MFGYKYRKNGATAQRLNGIAAQLELFPFRIVKYVVIVFYKAKSVISLEINLNQKLKHET